MKHIPQAGMEEGAWMIGYWKNLGRTIERLNGAKGSSSRCRILCHSIDQWEHVSTLAKSLVVKKKKVHASRLSLLTTRISFCPSTLIPTPSLPRSSDTVASIQESHVVREPAGDTRNHWTGCLTPQRGRPCTLCPSFQEVERPVPALPMAGRSCRFQAYQMLLERFSSSLGWTSSK